MHISIFISHHICLLTSFVSHLDIKALTVNCIVRVNYGVVFILNDLLYLITGMMTGALQTFNKHNTITDIDTITDQSS